MREHLESMQNNWTKPEMGSLQCQRNDWTEKFFGMGVRQEHHNKRKIWCNSKKRRCETEKKEQNECVVLSEGKLMKLTFFAV